MEKYLNRWVAGAALVAALSVWAGAAHAQAGAGFLGLRTVKGYWIEGSAFLAIKATTPFDNPTGCTQSDMAFVPLSHTQYKQILAAVVQAKATGARMQIFAGACYTAWGGNTWPLVHAVGVDWE